VSGRSAFQPGYRMGAGGEKNISHGQTLGKKRVKRGSLPSMGRRRYYLEYDAVTTFFGKETRHPAGLSAPYSCFGRSTELDDIAEKNEQPSLLIV